MFKALISDVDGTLVQNKKGAVPSAAVIKAIAQCQGLIHVGIATSRPLFMLRELFEQLPLSGPCVISGGTQIYDATTKKVVWEKKLEVEKMREVFEVLNRHNVPIFINDGTQDVPYDETKELEPALGIFVPEINQGLVQELHDELKTISGISAHQITAHTSGKVIIDITHGLATKQHGVMEVAKLLNIDTHEIIGIGDGYNDFPLLMACGLKVAMGNAVEELKEIADFIAPTVDEDGVAEVIAKYVLTQPLPPR